MWNAYAAVSALIFAIVSVMHVVRLINRWPFVIGPYDISMNVSPVALVVAGLIAIWASRNYAKGALALADAQPRKRVWELASNGTSIISLWWRDQFLRGFGPGEFSRRPFCEYNKPTSQNCDHNFLVRFGIVRFPSAKRSWQPS